MTRGEKLIIAAIAVIALILGVLEIITRKREAAREKSLKDELFHSHEIRHTHPPKEFTKGFMVEGDELYHTHEEEQ